MQYDEWRGHITEFTISSVRPAVNYIMELLNYLTGIFSSAIKMFCLSS
jgi:hypothetical protein